MTAPRIRRFTCDEKIHGATLTEAERFLREAAGIKPRSALKRAFLGGAVRVDGKTATRGTPLRAGSVIEVAMDGLYVASEARVKRAPAPALQVLLETPDIVVVNKPAGMPSHPQLPSEAGCALNAIAARYPECGAAFDPQRPLEGGLAHRLDAGTSGALVCARSASAWLALRRQWKAAGARKVYLAWLEGDLRSAGRVRLLLAHDPRSRRRMAIAREGSHGGRAWEAITSLEPIGRAREATLALVRIHTGVMHQIRATAAALGHPVLGDTLYSERTPCLTDDPKSLIQPLDRETEDLFGDLRTRLESRAGFVAAERAVPEAAGPALGARSGREFLLHALWIRIPGVAGIETGVFCAPPPDFARMPRRSRARLPRARRPRPRSR